MKNTDHGLRVCPTRIDSSPVLFAHKVDNPRCQERQRQRYHKCFTCAYNNTFVEKNGLPVPMAPLVDEQDAPVKVG